MMSGITRALLVKGLWATAFAALVSVSGCGGGSSGGGSEPGGATIQSFTKTSDSTLSWTTSGMVSCDITNDQSSEVFSVAADSLATGKLLHTLPAGTTFTLTCEKGGGGTVSQSVTSAATNLYPQTVGYYGSASSADNSWVAIVNLTNPITYIDHIDFNAQVDSYCTGLGYVGAAKTQSGDFSVHNTYYLQSSDGIISGNGPSVKVTLIPGDATYTNVYTNRRNNNSTSVGYAGRATIGNNGSTIVSATSPTSGANPMVLCQTDISLRETTLLPQTISFADPGPVRKVQGIDTSYSNTASGGLGSGAITYASSNPSVATVDANSGAVTLLALGTTTITATQAADTIFQQTQASYVLNFEAPLPAAIQSFSKTSDATLAWTTTGALSCDITNDQNAEVLNVTAGTEGSGSVLHTLPAGTTFTLSCLGEDGSTASQPVTTVVSNLYPQTVGYYGSASSPDNSWVAIVNLTSPISFIDRFDFNTQVDSYCTGLGYVGAAKTQNGDFSVHNTYYLQSSDGIIAGSGPSAKVTLIPGGATFTNVYTNRRNSNTSNGDVGVATIGNNDSTIIQSATSPTTGANQMVLCQTEISLRNTTPLPQAISFTEPGPIRKVQGIDTSYNNTASGGLGSGSITYASSNPSVATVDATSGALTLLALGTTTITATKAADTIFQQAQASYVLNFEAPLPIGLQSFTKTSDASLAWTTTGAASCDITNDQNSEVFNVAAGNLAIGSLLHPLPAGTTFTLSCQGEDGSTASQQVTTVATNLYPQTVGYYGSASSVDNSWVAIVNLTSPISFIDRIDFNAQVDSYCTGLGYIGAAKTRSGDFSVHDTYYLQTSDGIIAGSGPTAKVTLIPGNATFTNVYTNRRNSNTTNGNVGVATIGNNDSTIIQSVVGPTSGANQMVLCQTDISFRNTTLLPQTIGFADPGPVRKVQGLDTSFTNTASGGVGTGTITYASSNPSVATVDPTTGTVTLLALGTTTITATKAADTMFQEAQSSYVLSFEAPLPIGLQSFTKTSDATLAWATTGAVSCDITNDQNSEVFTVETGSLGVGSALHTLPAGATFTLSCQGEDGSTASQQVTTVVTNLYPQTVGYYGSASSADNSWVAIVNLTTPITFTDPYDFNAQVDGYCAGLGYVGAVKTKTGDISLHDTHYLHSGYGIIDVYGPSKKVTLIPGDLTFTNVYTNRTNSTSFQSVIRTTIGNNAATLTQSNVPSPTSGVAQMVLCQTDISFRNTTLLPQTISFAASGPIRKVQGLDSSYVNTASGGLGTGAITYASSNPSVATVDANSGAVTLVALGTTTITATKAADAIFQQTQTSYVLNFEAPLPIGLQSFTKTSDATLAWTTTGAVSCDITNNQNAEVLNVRAGTLGTGTALHTLPAGTTFTLSCQGEDGSAASQQVTTVVSNLYPQTVGYYGSASSEDNSWVAIVNLTSPISFIDGVDFNSQVDSYCSGLGYVGAAKTKTGDFSTNDTYYLQTQWGVITGNGPSKKVTLIPGDATFTNVYANETNYNTWSHVDRVSIGNNNAVRTQYSPPSPTSGVDQMVLCQTDIPFANTTLLPQTISFANPGPIRKVEGLDLTGFANTASGGLGSGAITYVSSNPSVATVNATTGAVSLLALGTTTITATKAADTIFQQAQVSYVLSYESPLPAAVQSFTKTSDATLAWTVTGAVSCEIANDQNSVVTPVAQGSLATGRLLHGLPAVTTFTLSCLGETGNTDSLSVANVDVNLYPNTLGYYGSVSSLDNSWVVMVNLLNPITFIDQVDFNTQVDSYCSGLGYIGAAKTKTGDFSVHDTYYLQSSDGIIAGSGPSAKVTLIPGDATFTNVYTNRRNNNSVSVGYAGRATIGNNASSISSAITSPTTGINPMVLCQTDISFRDTALLTQTIAFTDVGPVNKTFGVDTAFTNTASGGLGSGAITYTSSNPSVATVDANGLVTLVGVGTVTITATMAGDAQFLEAQASYVLNVN